jgi:hypothetical protein
MDLGELREAVQDWTQQSSLDYIAAPSEINRYINESQRRIHQRVAAKQLNFFKSTALLSEVVGVNTVNLPSSLYRLVRLERIVGGFASASHPAPMKRISDGNDTVWQSHGAYATRIQNYPHLYVMEGQKRIRLHPTPGISATDSMRVHYIFKPADMTADGHVPFQETAGTGGAGTDELSEYHDIIWKMASQMIAAKESDSEKYSLLKDQTSERMGELEFYLSNVDSGPRWVNVSIEDIDMFDD